MVGVHVLHHLMFQFATRCLILARSVIQFLVSVLNLIFELELGAGFGHRLVVSRMLSVKKSISSISVS